MTNSQENTELKEPSLNGPSTPTVMEEKRGDHSSMFEELEEEKEFAWMCRTCKSESDYREWGEEIPKGWRDGPALGLRCRTCVRNNVMPQ